MGEYSNTVMENKTNTTMVCPGRKLPTYLCFPTGIEISRHRMPSATRVPAYTEQVVAFLLQFPFGNSGLYGDPGIAPLAPNLKSTKDFQHDDTQTVP